MDPWTLVVGVAVVVCGSLLQGSVGIGLGILAAPVLALVAPATVPGPMLLSAFLLSLLLILRDRRDLDLKGATVALGGRIPGTAIGLALLLLLEGSPWLKVTLGSLLLVCVVLAGLRGSVTVQPRKRAVFFAGVLSGISGTAAGVGGPPVALVWSSLPVQRLRSTLAAYFLVGTGLSSLLLMLLGKFGSYPSLLWMLPATIIGFLLSRRAADHIDKNLTFKAVLLLSGTASLLLVLRGLWAALG